MIKKLHYLILLFLSLSFKGFSQGTPNIASLNLISDSCWVSTSSMLNVGVYVNNFTSGLTVDFHWGDGTQTTATSLQTYYYASKTYSLPGTYTVAAILMNGSTPIDTVTETFNTFCSHINGNAYKRMDTNCDYNPPTEPIINAPFSIQVRKAGVPVDTIESNGHISKYIASADLTSEFSLHLLSNPLGGTPVCPSAPYYFKFDTLTYLSTFPGFNFGFDCTGSTSVFDFYTTGTGFFRPVANSYIYIYPRNLACNPKDGTVTLQLTPKYSFASANITPTSVVGNTITWDIADISSTSFGAILITLNAVGTLSIGDTVINTVNITPTTGDLNPSNNTLVMIDSVRSSWDPNEKHVYPIRDIVDGQLLTYTIHFENLGNDTAFNIHIMDTLSQHLDANSFKFITSSHPASHQIFSTSAGNVLKFNFADILLADASAPDLNKGFVTFEIKAKTGLALGTTIENTAHIYFDINPAVVTNTTLNIIPIPTKIGENNLSKRINVYPNPTGDKLYIDNMQKFESISIYNALGQVVMSTNIVNAQSFISVKDLANGIYFIKAQAKDGEYLQKFVKQ